MSNGSNSAALEAHDAEGTRRRHYQDVTRLLKEYTGVMYEIADQVADCIDTQDAQSNGKKLSWSVFLAVWRYRSVWEQMRDVALFASQMLVHYHLDEAESAELRLRLSDAENGIEMTGLLINELRQDHGAAIGEPIPTRELDALVKQLQTSLRR